MLFDGPTMVPPGPQQAWIILTTSLKTNATTSVKQHVEVERAQVLPKDARYGTNLTAQASLVLRKWANSDHGQGTHIRPQTSSKST